MAWDRVGRQWGQNPAVSNPYDSRLGQRQSPAPDPYRDPPADPRFRDPYAQYRYGHPDPYAIPDRRPMRPGPPMGGRQDPRLAAASYGRGGLQAEAPYYGQMNGHRNQTMNCVPTSLAMSAAHFLRMDVLGANNLIGAISEQMLAMQGSRGVDGLDLLRPEILTRLGAELGLHLQHDAYAPAKLNQHLARGGHALVIGDAYALPYAQHLNRAQVDDAGHCILVHGLSGGRARVNDPAWPGGGEQLLDGRALELFVQSFPGHGQMVLVSPMY